MAPTPPSTIISNALGSFTKAVNLALNTIDEQAKADVARANAERDDALKELHELQLEEKEWEIRVEGWKAAWNTQANGTTPYTPKPQTSPTATKRASSSAHSLPALPTHKRLTPHARVPEDPTVSPRKIKSGVKPKPPIQADREVVYRQTEEHQATPGRSQKRNTTADAQLNARRKPQPRNSVAHLASYEPQSHPRQQVIRRVKAVIEVPVKEEDGDDHVLEAEESSASGSAYEPDDLPVRPVGARRKRQPRASAKGKEVQANWLEEDDSGEEQAVVRQVDEDDDDVDELVRL
ncbi:hypothetical protein A0H81_11146 [Grifola frondosa]|uniref:Uncharacterized protein n=1 Tax=Grifola frondosa TaxID=5627 RepID=A0A1C7LVZ0_GRIFR|nr:hypothetical protein A0H81_11146 [Grifola frondosa]